MAKKRQVPSSVLYASMGDYEIAEGDRGNGLDLSRVRKLVLKTLQVGTNSLFILLKEPVSS